MPSILWATTVNIDVGPMRVSQSITTWASLRDQQVVKQQFDFSCGASSLATLLTHHFDDPHTEADILDLFDHEEAAASFDDMKQVLSTLGYEAKGYAVTFDQLSTARAPVILYIRQKDNDHFVVLRAIDGEHVHVADPSTGNRFYSKHKFMNLWLTTSENKKGKILAVIRRTGSHSESMFFSKMVDHAQPIIFPSTSL